MKLTKTTIDEMKRFRDLMAVTGLWVIAFVTLFIIIFLTLSYRISIPAQHLVIINICLVLGSLVCITWDIFNYLFKHCQGEKVSLTQVGKMKIIFWLLVFATVTTAFAYGFFG